MTITTEEPPVAELVLRAGEEPTAQGYCANCGRAPCDWAPSASASLTAEQLCYRFRSHPQPLPQWAKDTSYRVLRNLELSGASEGWPSGTGDMLRALAEELMYWADRADREAGE
jgi:hypothetical protein